MTPKDLTGGDILRDQTGRTVTLVRNEDTGELWAVHISGFDDSGLRAENLSRVGDGFIAHHYTPLDTAWQRAHTARISENASETQSEPDTTAAQESGSDTL